MAHGSTTIPFTSPIGATEPFKTVTAIDPGTVISRSVTCRVNTSSFTTQPRRSARIAALQIYSKKG
jgi:hypothetical protein